MDVHPVKPRRLQPHPSSMTDPHTRARARAKTQCMVDPHTLQLLEGRPEERRVAGVAEEAVLLCRVEVLTMPAVLISRSVPLPGV